ncbi:MAG: glycosyltransferase family 39 protein [Solirubrobacteraceae bacterium]
MATSTDSMPDRTVPADRLTRRIDLTTAATAALTVLAFAVASYHLGTKSMWLDEAVSADHARLGFSGLWKVLSGGDPNMGLYYVLLHFWVRIFGYGEAAVRSMSVVLAAWAVPAIVALGRRLFGAATGLIAGLLLALAPFFVQYEQTARSYGLLVLLVVLSSYFFVRMLEKPTRALLIGYVIASTLAVYAQYFAALVLIVQLATLLTLRRREALTRSWWTAAGAIVVLCSPEAVFALRKGNGGIAWIPDPTFGSLFRLPSALAGTHALAAVLAVLACWGFACAMRAGGRWQSGFLATWLLGPVLLVFVVSKLGHPLFVNYYLIIVLPAFLLLAALGVAKLPAVGMARGLPVAPLSAIALVLLVALSTIGLRDWYDSSSVEDYRGLTRYILGHAQAGDGAIYYPAQTVSYGVSYYSELSGKMGPAQIAYRLGSPPAAKPARLWLVVRDAGASSTVTENIKRSLSDTYEPQGETQPRFTGLDVLLYQRKVR